MSVLRESAKVKTRRRNVTGAKIERALRQCNAQGGMCARRNFSGRRCGAILGIAREFC